MDLFNSPEQIQSVLAGYDREEQEMNRVLASLARYGPKASYEAYKRACERSMKQITMRRRLFGRLINE